MKNKTLSQPSEKYKEFDCCLVHYQVLHLKHCFILCKQNTIHIPEAQLLDFTYLEAQRLSLHYTQHPNQFILVLSGQKIRRRENWHTHIFIVNNRYQKALVYQILAIKNFGLFAFNVIKKRCNHSVL